MLAGVYASFSVMVMPALSRLSDREATTAMAGINRAAERGPFLALFTLTALAAVGLVIEAAPRGDARELIAAGASLASTAVTVLVNVPLNRQLDRVGQSSWPTYRRRWTVWNTVRAGMATAAVIVAVAF
nr:anthrone oxygenase family protein [Arthrobacter roseus]